MSVLRYLIFICLPLLLMSAAVPVWPQKSLAVTIYNSDFAMVKDVRSLTFPEGNSKLSFTDVSRNIQP